MTTQYTLLQIKTTGSGASFTQAELVKEIKKIGQVESIDLTTGEWDYMARLAVQPAEFNKVKDQLLQFKSLPGIQATQTSFAYSVAG